MSGKRPSDIAKACGLESLAEMVRLSGRSERTLIQWAHEQPEFFKIVALGCAEHKNRKII